jgi:L-ascorbate metabolism protein UlaG (beta-lactamase superfamily)
MRLLLSLFILLGCLPTMLAAQSRASHCIALVQDVPNAHLIVPVQLAGPPEPPLNYDEVRIRYVGHSTFLITTPEGHQIATDFTGYAGQGVTPDVVTMNRAHSSHYTDFPDPAIPHVLRGWVSEDGSFPAQHRLVLGNTLIRNVTTDIRSFSGQQDDGNSIFVFEAGGLCIGHLGHLHHEPSDAHYALIGRLDVVMVPVDGGLTLDLPTMMRVTERLRASVVIPMHWWGLGSLSRFVEGLSERYTLADEGSWETVVSLRNLPRQPQIRLLAGANGLGAGAGGGFRGPATP